MTAQEFDTYRFTVNTMVLYGDGQWSSVIEVNFKDRTVSVEYTRSDTADRPTFRYWADTGIISHSRVLEYADILLIKESNE